MNQDIRWQQRFDNYQRALHQSGSDTDFQKTDLAPAVELLCRRLLAWVKAR
jgi:molecular chaperone GrpE (heat shock protein)